MNQNQWLSLKNGTGRQLTMSEIQAEVFRRVLGETGGSVMRTCKVLGIPRTSAYRHFQGVIDEYRAKTNTL